MFLRTLIRVAVLAIGVSSCSSLFAVSFNWQFAGSTNQGSVGNSFSFTPVAGGPTITATAWYLDASNNFQQAALGIYANGLGVCYPGESCTNPNSQTDDSVFREFIMLESSTLIDPLSVRITTAGDDGGGSPSDTDVTYWLGSINGQGLNLTNMTVAGLSGLGFGSRTNNNMGTDLASGSWRNVSLTQGNSGYTKLIFGAALTGGSDDYFSVTSLNASSVPEPSSVLLLATIGLAFVGLARRSRRLSN